MPGGVSSPVRAFGSVGGEPFFTASGSGCRIRDVDGNEYLDYVLSWGPLLLGHAHPAVVHAVQEAAARGTSFGTPSESEVELAELIREAMPSMERIRFVNSGTEATMSALRLARAATGRSLVLKFEGCYHGHADSFLVRAGSGVATLGLPDSPGVPSALSLLTITVPFNDLDAVADAFREHGDGIAAVIVEPVVGNAGLLLPADGFLPGLRHITERHGSLLIFDEVMTGFRVAPGGAQDRYGVRPDLTTLGKVIGAGLPVGVYGGRADLMRQVAPEGPVYQAGTLSGNPLAMAAGIAQLRYLRENDPFEYLARRAARLADGLEDVGRDAGILLSTVSVGSMFGLFFRDSLPRDFREAREGDAEQFARFHRAALARGLFFAPSPFEAGFVSTAHEDSDVEETIQKAGDALRQMDR